MIDPRALSQCVEIAAKHADEVDRDGRFPCEAIDALRTACLISPAGRGTGGIASIAESSRIVRALAAACASTGMVVGMHYTQLSALARYSRGNDHLRALLATLMRSQGLIASSTTERSTGGDTSRSTCAVVPATAGGVALRKDASVISYASRADAILVTARRREDAEPTDQVLVACERDALDLSSTSGWDALGMRGTESNGYLLSAVLPAQAVFGTPYSTILAEDMVAVTHVMWTSVWLGIADAIVQKVRSKLARSRDAIGSHRFYEMLAKRQSMESMLSCVREESETRSSDSTTSFAATLRATTLKTVVSENLVAIAVEGLAILGMAGYANDSNLTIGRLVRDAMSAPLMVANDRIRKNSADLALVASRQKEPWGN